MAFDLPGSMIGAPFVEDTSVPYGYPRHKIRDPLRMRRGYKGIGNEDRGNPLPQGTEPWQVQSDHAMDRQQQDLPGFGSLSRLQEEDPGMALDREQGKESMLPPLTPPEFKSGAGGGFSGLERWLGKYGEHPSPYPNLATDPWLGR